MFFPKKTRTLMPLSELLTLLFWIIYKRVTYTELFAYRIEKQSIYVRNRYSKNIPKKKGTVTLLHTEKHFVGRKKRQNRKEKEAKMKVGKK